MVAVVCDNIWVGFMTLGEFINSYLEAHGLTQREFAERSNKQLNQADISRMVNGNRPTPEKLRILANLTEVPYNRLAVMVGYADPVQLPLDNAPEPHERMLTDILEHAATRPDLIRFIRELQSEENDEAYRRAVATAWRSLAAQIENSRDLLAPEPVTDKR